MERPQLYALARPIPAHLIEKPPQGKYGNYVPHFVITQALLVAVGPYDFELVPGTILRGYVPASKDQAGNVKHPALADAVVGGVWRLTVTVDGRRTSIEEVGVCDAGPHETNDAARLKKAASDAIKRCAMRLGVALHVWCKRPEQYFLARLLREGSDGETSEVAAVGGVAGEADDA